MVRLGEGAGRAPLIRAMLKMKDEPQVCALKGRGVRLFEVRCAGGSESNGEGRGRKVA